MYFSSARFDLPFKEMSLNLLQPHWTVVESEAGRHDLKIISPFFMPYHDEQNVFLPKTYSYVLKLGNKIKC